MSLPYFPLYPKDFEAKTSHLTLEEDGAYNRLLRLCWLTQGCSLPDDPSWIARRLRVDSSTYERLVAPLISEFFRRTKGRVWQPTLTEIFQETNEKHSRRVEAGKLGGRPPKPPQQKENVQSNAKAMPKQPEPEPEKKEREVNLSRASVETDDCIAHFNATAQRVGWSQVQKITPARKAALIHRMADCGGADAWCEAMDRAASSPLLTGQTGRGWRADFDWLCKAANFTKLMEGNYDPRNSDQGQPRPGQGNSMAEVFMAVGAARSRRSGTSGGSGEWPDGSVQ
jgi:uncharacterized protein YdaU (DUF1376 family)